MRPRAFAAISRAPQRRHTNHSWFSGTDLSKVSQATLLPSPNGEFINTSRISFASTRRMRCLVPRRRKGSVVCRTPFTASLTRAATGSKICCLGLFKNCASSTSEKSSSRCRFSGARPGRKPIPSCFRCSTNAFRAALKCRSKLAFYREEAIPFRRQDASPQRFP